MKRFVTIGKALGLAGPVALALFGLGCVNLDEPAEVAECAANKTCSNGEKKDAAVSKDDDASDSGTRRPIWPPTAWCPVTPGLPMMLCP